MTYSRLIHDYLDSGLDGSTEANLFSELARNTELRNEFNQQMQVHLLAKEDFAKIMPPVNVTNAVFAGLGFNIPTDEFFHSAIESQEEQNKTKTFIKKNIVWLLLLLLSFSAIPIAYYYNVDRGNSNLYNGDGNNRRTSSNIPLLVSYDYSNNYLSYNSQGQTVSNNEKSQNISHKADFFDEEKLNNRIKNANSINKNRNLNANGNDFSNSNIIINEANGTDNASLMLSITQSEYNTNQQNNRSFLIRSFNNKFKNKYINNNNILLSLSEIIEIINSNLMQLSDSKYQLNLKSINSNMNSPDFALQQNNLFYNNLALSFKYNYNDYHTFGIELGNERFNQKFTYQNNGLNYIQSPIIYYIGASYQFNARTLIIPDYLYPYFSITGGASNVGPIFKGQIGMDWKITSSMGINLGTEYGLLYYNVDGFIYNSQKLGLIIGLNYNF